MIPNSILVHSVLAIEIKILFPELIMEILIPHKSWTRMERGILDSHADTLQAFIVGS